MAELEKIKQFLLENRDVKKANLMEEITERDGYFDAQELSGGNFDDAFTLGREVGESQLIEVLLSLIEDESE